MEYTVRQLADLAGISSRTLRFYDQKGLLKPEKINDSGYRIYGPDQVDRLQQILFYRELGFSLKAIKAIMNRPDADLIPTLTKHRLALIKERQRLDRLIGTVDKTIAEKKGGRHMTDSEKFEGFKQDLIDRNEKQYGQEIREKYGEEAVEQSYEKMRGMNPEDYEKSEKLQCELFAELSEAMSDRNPAGAHAQKAADLHRQWLSFFWGAYTKEAHAGLAQMYVDDPRFSRFYDDAVAEGAAKMLRDAIFIYTGKK